MYEEQRVSATMTASSGSARLSTEKPDTRLGMVRQQLEAAENRLHELVTRVSQVNQQLIGNAGPPRTEDGSKELPSPGGAVADLEMAVSRIHGVISELEQLIGYQREMGIVA